MPEASNHLHEQPDREVMLGHDELDELDELSSQRLYRAELQRVPRLSLEDQEAYIRAAQDGDLEARNALILHCLNWTRLKAYDIAAEREPAHTDILDLAAHGSLMMLEAVPSAVRAKDPIRYLMSVAAHEMKRYCVYADPLIMRPRGLPYLPDAPLTTSLNASEHPLSESLSAPEEPTTEEESINSPEYQLVYHALAQVRQDRRDLLIAYYGLFGRPPMAYHEMAQQFGISYQMVGHRIFRGRQDMARILAPYTLHGAEPPWDEECDERCDVTS